MLSPGSSASAAELHRMLEFLSMAPPGSAPESAVSLPESAALMARLRALSREAVPAGSDETLSLGELSIDFAGHEVRVGGHKVHLTHREFALLSFLVLHRGRVCKREELLAQLWADRRLSSDRTVDIHVYRLRTKLGALPNLIETIRNVGYVIRTSDAAE
jgi:DNA-binding response OmpR family regulator